MDRLFLDANVLFSAAYRPASRLLELWKVKHVSLLSSRYALAEAEINLEKAEQRERLSELAKGLHFVEASRRFLPRGVQLPEKDIPILLAAIESRATHLLTGDLRDFGPYFGTKIEGVRVILPGEYLRKKKQ